MGDLSMLPGERPSGHWTRAQLIHWLERRGFACYNGKNRMQLLIVAQLQWEQEMTEGN